MKADLDSKREEMVTEYDNIEVKYKTELIKVKVSRTSATSLPDPWLSPLRRLLRSPTRTWRSTGRPWTGDSSFSLLRSRAAGSIFDFTARSCRSTVTR